MWLYGFLLLTIPLTTVKCTEAEATVEAAFQGRCGHGSPCDQLCYELHDGMYECDCTDGYELAKNGYSCQVINSTYSSNDDRNIHTEEDVLYQKGASFSAKLDNSNVHSTFRNNNNNNLNFYSNNKISNKNNFYNNTSDDNNNFSQNSSDNNNNNNGYSYSKINNIKEDNQFDITNHNVIDNNIDDNNENGDNSDENDTSEEIDLNSDYFNHMVSNIMNDELIYSDDNNNNNKHYNYRTVLPTIPTSSSSKYIKPSKLITTIPTITITSTSPTPVFQENEMINDNYLLTNEDMSVYDDVNNNRLNLRNINNYQGIQKYNTKKPNPIIDNNNNNNNNDNVDVDDNNDNIKSYIHIEVYKGNLDEDLYNNNNERMALLTTIITPTTKTSSTESIPTKRFSSMNISKDFINHSDLNQKISTTRLSELTESSSSPLPIMAISTKEPCLLDCGLDGICDNNNGIIRCRCPFGKTGIKCEEDIKLNTLRFAKKSWIAFSALRGAYKHVQLHIEFRPEQRDGIILLTGERDDLTGDFMAVLIVEGFIEFWFDCGSGTGKVKSDEQVIVNQWNTITVFRHRWDAWLSLNQGTRVQGRSQGLFSRITFQEPVFLGGTGNITGLAKKLPVSYGMVGCIRKFIANEHEYELSHFPFGDIIQGFDVQECITDRCGRFPCHHGGKCLPSDQGAVCLCPLGYGGDLCEMRLDLQIPSFNGSSYLRYAPLGYSCIIWLELKMIIKPMVEDGLLLFSGHHEHGDYIALYLNMGFVEFAFDLGSGPAVVRSQSPIEMDQWHTIQISRTARLAVLKIDQLPEVMTTSPTGFWYLSLPHSLFLGGIHSGQNLPESIKITNFFVGCIQKVEINGQPLLIIAEALGGTNVENCPHACITRPCGPLAQCIPSLENYECQCNPLNTQCNKAAELTSLDIFTSITGTTGTTTNNYDEKDIIKDYKNNQNENSSKLKGIDNRFNANENEQKSNNEENYEYNNKKSVPSIYKDGGDVDDDDDDDIDEDSYDIDYYYTDNSSGDNNDYNTKNSNEENPKYKNIKITTEKTYIKIQSNKDMNPNIEEDYNDENTNNNNNNNNSNKNDNYDDKNGDDDNDDDDENDEDTSDENINHDNISINYTTEKPLSNTKINNDDNLLTVTRVIGRYMSVDTEQLLKRDEEQRKRKRNHNRTKKPSHNNQQEEDELIDERLNNRKNIKRKKFNLTNNKKLMKKEIKLLNNKSIKIPTSFITHKTNTIITSTTGPLYNFNHKVVTTSSYDEDNVVRESRIPYMDDDPALSKSKNVFSDIENVLTTQELIDNMKRIMKNGNDKHQSKATPITFPTSTATTATTTTTKTTTAIKQQSSVELPSKHKMNIFKRGHGACFTGADSYFHYSDAETMREIISYKIDINLRFKTHSNNGLILWSGRHSAQEDDDFLSLGIENGYLHLRYNLGSGEVNILHNTTKVSDGLWHRVRAFRNLQDGSLEIDDGKTVFMRSPGKLRQLNTDTGLYVGGMPDVLYYTKRIYYSGIVGCISEIILSGELRLSLDPETLGTAHNVEPGIF